MSLEAESILVFWFGQPPLVPQSKLWWGGKQNDARIKHRFGDAVEAALAGEFDSWDRTPRTALALIILLDQMTRNVYRGSARAFAGDARALAVTRHGLEQDFVDRLHPLEAVFFLMPLEHDEDLASQQRCERQLKRLISRAGADFRDDLQGYLDYARAHREIIERFGRFPHRNELLGRTSTPGEIEYLATGGRRFGQ